MKSGRKKLRTSKVNLLSIKAVAIYATLRRFPSFPLPCLHEAADDGPEPAYRDRDAERLSLGRTGKRR